jgi:hypothetical protein
MARRLSPYQHVGEVVHPRDGFLPLTAGPDVTDARWREYHVRAVRRSDGITLTHVSFKVRR